MKLIYLPLLLLFGCNFTDEPHYEVDPRIRKYVDQFFVEAEIRGYGDLKPYYLEARIENLSGLTEGQTRYKVTGHFIYIDSDYYTDMMYLLSKYPKDKTFYERQIEIIVFHELGHSILGLEHCKDDMALMASDAGDKYGYGSDDKIRSEMIDNMFKRF